MLHRAAIVEVLFETDCPEIVVARDDSSTLYLSVLSERTVAGDRFLCVAISPRRLVMFRNGAVDLRDALLNRETLAYVADFHRDGKVQYLHLEPLEEVPVSWLPQPGFVLGDVEQNAPLMVLEIRANERRAFAGVLKLNPPEAEHEPRIDSYHLSTGIRLFQDLVMRAGDKVRADMSETKRRTVGRHDPFALHVLPAFTGGSFEVHLESSFASDADIWGHTLVGEALSKVDEITRYIDDPESALPVLRKNAGHLVRAYQAMLRFVTVEKVPMAYRWADPGTVETSHPIGIASAQRTYDLLVATQDLTSVEVEHVGRFVNLGEKGAAGTWKLNIGEKKGAIKGETLPGKDDLLSGITFKTQLYRVKCEERIEESVVSGKTKKLYFLKEIPVPVVGLVDR